MNIFQLLHFRYFSYTLQCIVISNSTFSEGSCMKHKTQYCISELMSPEISIHLRYILFNFLIHLILTAILFPLKLSYNQGLYSSSKNNESSTPRIMKCHRKEQYVKTQGNSDYWMNNWKVRLHEWEFVSLYLIQ